MAQGMTKPVGSLAIGSSTVGSGTANRVLFEAAGPVLSDSANLTWDGTDLGLGSGNRFRMQGQNRHRYLNSMCRAVDTGLQSIANITLTAITFSAEDFDTDGLHSTSVNTSRVTAALTGKYAMSAQAQFAGPAGTYLVLCRITLNGNANAVLAEARQIASTGSSDMVNPSTIYALTAGDYIEAYVFQSSGVAVNISGSGVPLYLAMAYIGE